MGSHGREWLKGLDVVVRFCLEGDLLQDLYVETSIWLLACGGNPFHRAFAEGTVGTFTEKGQV